MEWQGLSDDIFLRIAMHWYVVGSLWSHFFKNHYACLQLHHLHSLLMESFRSLVVYSWTMELEDSGSASLCGVFVAGRCSPSTFVFLESTE